MQILLKNEKNKFTSVLRLFPVQTCSEMFRKKVKRVDFLKVGKMMKK